ncbi:hypothetical protein [Bradyrhizobium sp. AZCC 2230]|uniref:hypothetical protein n=1 Tax=Bradyrhizobium sp. AZCC 2230 TaxID=3117021 RepID=UPI002FF35CD6
MKSAKRSLAVVAVMMSAIIVGLPRSSAMENNAPIAYFSEGAPDNLVEAMNNLPPDARDVVVAKVRLQQPVAWMGGRHCEGCTNDIFFARLKITEALRGQAEVGQVLNVFLGKRSEHREHIAVPGSPRQWCREYTVVIYTTDDGIRRLASFQISKTLYDEVSAEGLAYQGERPKRGFCD